MNARAPTDTRASRNLCGVHGALIETRTEGDAA
jgi:hypothetical protein